MNSNTLPYFEVLGLSSDIHIDYLSLYLLTISPGVQDYIQYFLTYAVIGSNELLVNVRMGFNVQVSHILTKKKKEKNKNMRCVNLKNTAIKYKGKRSV